MTLELNGRFLKEEIRKGSEECNSFVWFDLVFDAWPQWQQRSAGKCVGGMDHGYPEDMRIPGVFYWRPPKSSMDKKANLDWIG